MRRPNTLSPRDLALVKKADLVAMPVVPSPPTTLPRQHPLEMWELEEAARHLRVSAEFLDSSLCPRIKWGRRRLFDPIETIAFVRSHLTHVVSTERDA